MSGERAKLFGLGLVLAVIARSYVKSDVFTHGVMMSTTARFFEDNLCEGRPPALRAECKATLATALAPAKLSCMSAFHDVVLCQHPADNGGGGGGDGNKRRCRKEQQKRSECLQAHLRPYGFSDEEIVRLLWKNQQSTPPQSEPSVEVADHGREGGEKAKANKRPGEGDGAGGKRANRGDETNVEKGAPKVEVEHEPKQGGGGAR
ncbi:unnamed protein product [Ectocarpus fasciculatus]